MKRLILLIYIVSFFACGGAEKESETIVTKVSYSGERPIVEVVRPELKVLEGDVAIMGNLEANQRVSLYAMEGGMVSSISKDIGDVVQEGEIIAELSNPELVLQLKQAEAHHQQTKQAAAMAAAALKKAETTRAYRKKKYDRLNRIYGKTPDLVTVEDMDQAEAENLIAQAAYSEAKAQNDHAGAAIESAKALVDILQERVNLLTVKAPFTGSITHRYVDQGALVMNSLNNSNATPIVDLVDISKLRLVIEYPEAELAYVSRGSKVEINFPEAGDLKYLGEISRMAAALNPKSKTARAEIDIEDKNAKLKPGMYARVHTKQRKKKEVLAVPAQAITTVKNQNFIFVVRDNLVEKIPVRLGLEDNSFVEVICDELKGEDLVIVQGKGLVSEGMEVEVKIK